MSESLPTYIDPIKLAQHQGQLQGSLPLTAMPRLVASLCDSNGLVEMNWCFGFDAQQRLTVTGTLQAAFLLTCQRCLQPMPWQINATIALTQLAAGQTEADLPTGFEAFEWAERTDAQPLLLLRECVEDELILGLPLVPRHQQCPNNDYQTTASNDLAFKETRKNPFAVLADLKNKA